MEEEPTVKLTCADGVEYVVPMSVANMSETIKSLIQDAGVDNAIPLPGITNKILSKVVEYCKHHVNDTAPNPEDKDKMNIAPWDLAFCAVDQQTLFELVMAANYLDIPGLLNLACATVANLIKGKTEVEIMTIFGIVDEFTPEEQEQMRKENEWVDS